MAHSQQGDTRVGDDGVHWVFDGGIWRGDRDMYKPCPVMVDNNGTFFQYFPTADVVRHYRWYRNDGACADYYVTDDDEEE